MRAVTTTTLQHSKSKERRARVRNSQKFSRNALRPAAGREPNRELDPPILAGELLTGGKISFLEFLSDGACEKFCNLLFGGADTSAGTMLREFRSATEFHYFGHRRGKPGRKKPRNPGKLIESKAATKKRLKKFARLAYRGDPDRRGVAFWERVAWLLWDSYAALMALRRRAERIKQQEIKRIASLPAKRAERAAYMRRYRDKQRAKGARYFKEEAKRRWRERRGGSTS